MSLKYLFAPALLALGLCMGATPADAGTTTTHKKHNGPSATAAASSKAGAGKHEGPAHHRHHKHGGKGGKNGGHGKQGHKHKNGK